MAAEAFEALAGTRPRIRRDVLFTETPGGVLFHNADGGFHLTGRTAYRFASLLVPHLSGEHRLAEICDGFGASQQAMAAGLVEKLYARGFARDNPAPAPSAPPSASGPPAAPGAPGTEPGAAADRFAAQIAYIDHYTDGAPERFRRFRDTRVAVLGGDAVARWCALSLIRNGCARIGVPGGFEGFGEVADEARTLEAEGCPVRIDPVAGDERWEQLTGYDVVVVTGAGAAARTHRLLAEGVPAGSTLIPSWSFGEHAVTGPLNTAEGTGCWSCALLRMGGNADAGAAADLWSEVAAGPAASPPAGDGPLFGPIAAMTGNLLGYEIFRLTTGALPAETRQQVLIQDLYTLDVLAEPVQPHPRCRVCAPGPGSGPGTGTGNGGTTDEAERVLTAGPDLPRTVTVESARDAERLVDDLNALSTALVRTWTGTFTRFDDEELTQTPLKISRVEVPLGHGGKRRIAAFDVHHLAGARMRALQVAAGTYVEHVVPVGGAELTATSLLTKEPVRVPAAAVRTFGPYNRERLFPASSAGTGAGRTPQEAVGSGLLSALAHDALLRAVRGGTRVGLLPAEGAVPADPELVFLRKSAGNLGVGVELLDLGESERSSAHVVLARETRPADAGPGRWAVGCELSRTAAASAALRDLLGQVQLAAEDAGTGGADGVDGADGAVEAVDMGDPLVPDLDPGTLVVTDGPADAADTTWEAVLDRLRSAGRDVLFVPTTPADLLAGGLATARVILRDQAAATTRAEAAGTEGGADAR